MIVGSHQPNFLPWLGFFDKMAKADLFVILDHVQYENRGFQNRTKIKTKQGPQWITVPVKQCSRDERVMDKLLDNDVQGRSGWGNRLGATIRHAYGKAPYFSHVVPVIEILEAPWERLIDLNLRLMELCRQQLDIKTPIVRSSELKIAGKKSEMILNLCREIGADTYLSGTGGSKAYLDNAAFEEAGVRIQWRDFPHPTYPQHPPSEVFIEKMSVIDLLANCGPMSRSFLDKGFSEKK